VVQAALDAGHDVRTLARREWMGCPTVPAANRFLGQLPFQVPADLFDGAQAVVHCAAISDPSEALSHAVNVLGTHNLALAARAAGVETFVFLSSQSARADAAAAYGRTKHEAEQALLSLADFQVIILRPGLVCGSGGLFGRIARTVMRLPVVPVVAPDALVQPLLVHDLVAGILRAIEQPTVLAGGIFELGLDPGVRLGTFMRLVADELATAPKRLVPVPLAILERAAAFAEHIGVELPIRSTSLAAMRLVRPMSTHADMDRLGLSTRDAHEIVRFGVADVLQSAIQRPTSVDLVTRTLLVGAGRIGLVHAISLSRLPGMVLAGVADRSPQARGLLRSTGIKTRYFDSLEAALAVGQFDTAVIATPPATHLPIARICAQCGLATLVEKPAAITEEHLTAFGQLGTESKVLVGYLMLRLPHVRRWLGNLKRGDLGRVRKFEAYTLLSLINAPNPTRWEARREVSGGGVISNSAGHVLSLIVDGFGQPTRLTTQTATTYSTDVEDSAIVHFDYGDFTGVLFASWVIRRFPRQESRLVVWTDRGRLTLTPSLAVFEDADGGVNISHPLDEPSGFNLAPDYGGGGIAQELADLRPGAPQTDVVTIERALEVERLILAIYRSAAAVERFVEPPTSPAMAHDADGPPGVTPTGDMPSMPGPRRIADLRDVESSMLRKAQADLSQAWAGALVFAGGYRDAAAIYGPDCLWVTVPDFLGQTRLLSNKHYTGLARQLGAMGVLGLLVGALGALPRERSVGFWVAAQGLLAGDLARIPATFRGTLLLHPYLTDLALALGAADRLEHLLGFMRARKRHARIGVHSNLGLELANAVVGMNEPPQLLSVLTAADRGPLAAMRTWLDSVVATRRVELAAEVGPGPQAVHRIAYREPARWATGRATSVLVSGYASQGLFAAATADLSERWNEAFPGLTQRQALW
jgi:predicted dehydrogenase/nucleoside-diphosphate-sugar epimerase